MIIDTFTDFLDYYEQASPHPVEKQVCLWETTYMAGYPELFQKQVTCYAEDGLDWHDIAKKVIPAYGERLLLMKSARENILAIGESVLEQARERLGFGFPVTIVVYTGIG